MKFTEIVGPKMSFFNRFHPDQSWNTHCVSKIFKYYPLGVFNEINPKSFNLVMADAPYFEDGLAYWIW